MRISDWSSDVCSSDLTRDATTTGQPASIDAIGFLAYADKVAQKLLEVEVGHAALTDLRATVTRPAGGNSRSGTAISRNRDTPGRSEARRVGTALVRTCRSRR